ncbi:energy transducer TonB [bacterium]|nr:energy transducer TonB [bacterium]
MKSEENIDLKVTQDGLRFSGIYSLKIKDTNNRKRMYASLVIINSLANFFMQQHLKVSNTKNIYKVAKLSEEYEITDLYVNNWRIDVRLAMPGECFYIPVSHFENEILPDFYLVATIDKNLQTPQFIGYVSPKNLKYEKYNNLYYKSGFDELKDMSDLLQELREENTVDNSEKDHKFFNTKILSYLDDEADNFTKQKLLHHLLNCPVCRTELINFCGFDMIATNLEHYNDLFEDESLNIIGALNAQDDEEEDEAAKHQREQEEKEERIKNLTKEKNDVLIDGLFENTPKVTPRKPKEEGTLEEPKIELKPDDNPIKLGSEDSLFLQDVPTLEETMLQGQNKPTEIRFEKEEAPKQAPPVRPSLADSLKDIPDEMFNTEYENKKAIKKSTGEHRATEGKTEKVIIDYDEFGQPIYGEEKSEDYTIVEGEGVDTFTKETKENPDITDTFTKDDGVIESSGENVSEELISKIPPQSTQEKPKSHLLVIALIGVLAIWGIYSFLIAPKSSNTSTPTDIPGELGGSGMESTIVKNINNNTGFVKLKSLNWVAQNSLLTNPDFRSYLQIIDKRFRAKFKLNTNSITQAPYSNNVVVEVIITPEGLIKSSRISPSSGVKSIDEAIMQSLREATSSIQIPAATQEELKLDEYYVKMVIKL